MSGLASGRSILFIATTIGTLGGPGVVDRLDRLRLTPSTAATTSTTTSVMFAPRARMLVNAWWPGVSMNVTRFLLAVAAVDLDHPRGGVLRDAAGLAGGDVGAADLVQQARLAVVDVAEDRDDRRAA